MTVFAIESFSPDLARASVETPKSRYNKQRWVGFSPDLARASVETVSGRRF